MVAVHIRGGRRFEICALEVNGRNQVLDFVLELKAAAGKDYAKLMQAFVWTAEYGLMIHIPERFRQLNENIFEFKIAGGVSVHCFLDGSSLLMLTNGFKKNGKSADAISRSGDIRVAYLNAKKSECITYKRES